MLWNAHHPYRVRSEPPLNLDFLLVYVKCPTPQAFVHIIIFTYGNKYLSIMLVICTIFFLFSKSWRIRNCLCFLRATISLNTPSSGWVQNPGTLNLKVNSNTLKKSLCCFLLLCYIQIQFQLPAPSSLLSGKCYGHGFPFPFVLESSQHLLSCWKTLSDIQARRLWAELPLLLTGADSRLL